VEHSTPEQVSVALGEILRDDMNVDISRITPDSLVAAGMKPDYEGYAEFNQLP
jgi:hypothetical protein